MENTPEALCEPNKLIKQKTFLVYGQYVENSILSIFFSLNGVLLREILSFQGKEICKDTL